MGVLGHGFYRNATHFQQLLAADDGARTAEERRVPEVVAVLDDAVEQLALVGHPVERVQVALKRIG